MHNTPKADFMRAYQLVRPGKAEVTTLPIPEPGAGQIRLRIAGAGLCHSDLTLMAFDPPIAPLPKILGHEATGWIDKLGAHVQGLTVGDAYGVYFSWGCGRCPPCAHGEENVCDHAAVTPGFGTGLDGAMADYVLIDHPRHLVPLGALDPVAAAPLMCAGITTYNTIRQGLPVLTPRSSAVVIGVGGLGHIAIQILRALSPARIIAVDTDPEKLAQATRLGAHHGVPGGPDAAPSIRALTGDLGATLVIDLVGIDATLALARAILAQRGQLKLVGVGGGTLPLRFFEMPREAAVSIPYAGTLTDLIAVVELAARDLVRPEVTRIGFDALEETYALMAAGKLQGRAVLTPGTEA
jgi:propanol-preferring alcohol dehydrogenase